MSILLFDNQSSPNLLSNPGFETPGGGGADIWANWSEVVGDGALANEAVVVHEGADSAKMTAGAIGNTHIYQGMAVVPGTTYRLRFWAQGDGVNAGGYRVYDGTNAAEIIARTTIGVTGAAYGIVDVIWTAPAGCVLAYMYFYSPTVNGGFCYFDTCEVRSA